MDGKSGKAFSTAVPSHSSPSVMGQLETSSLLPSAVPPLSAPSTEPDLTPAPAVPSRASILTDSNLRLLLRLKYATLDMIDEQIANEKIQQKLKQELEIYNFDAGEGVA